MTRVDIVLESLSFGLFWKFLVLTRSSNVVNIKADKKKFESERQWSDAVAFRKSQCKVEVGPLKFIYSQCCTKIFVELMWICTKLRLQLELLIFFQTSPTSQSTWNSTRSVSWKVLFRRRFCDFHFPLPLVGPFQMVVLSLISMTILCNILLIHGTVAVCRFYSFLF